MKTLIVLVLLVLSISAQAACQKSTKSVKNKDQSVLMLTEEVCDGQTGRTVSLQITRANERAASTLMQKAVPKTVRFLDLEGDGTYEFEEIGSCAGLPDCEAFIYKLNPERSALKLYFQGAYSEVSVVDGYIVESGRSSCCSWEHHLYRADSAKLPITEVDMVYRVKVQAPESLGYASCQFSERAGRGWRPVKLPSQGLKKLCEAYGKNYRINT